jgi:hypothetical protein
MVLALCIAGTASAATIGLTVTPDPQTAYGNGGWVLGYSFLANSPISVVSLGVYDADGDGLAGSHDVGLWDSSGTLLASTTVPSGTGGSLNAGFRFSSIAPVVLSSGSTYYVGATALGEGDLWLEDPLSLTPAPEITYDSRRYTSSSGSLVFPDAAGSGSTGYFGANFEFDSAAVPEPATFGILGVGLAALAVLRRRA